MTIQENISLKPLHTFGIEAKARWFTSFSSLNELHEILTLPQSPNTSIPQYLILGGGSNILFTSDYSGLVMKNELKGIVFEKQDEEHIYIRVGAGENWHQFVLYCVQNNYAGVENLSLIPGNVGASPMQNIGAYGVEIKDVFYDLHAFHLKEKTLERFILPDCEFGYRDSVFKGKFKNQFVITDVCFRLKKEPAFNTSYGAIEQELQRMGIKNLSIKAISDAVINIRSSKLPDPKEIGNAGSFFKNPLVSNERFKKLKEHFPGIVAFPAGDAHTKLAAGWLIEQCGWKGYRKGDAGCFSKQALVLVNYGSARGEEIFQLSEDIIHSVREKFGVLLEREVNII
ncbi:MAG: UDP-N-acetylmuramate dehydrogenase [Flavisolibacter sp.]